MKNKLAIIGNGTGGAISAAKATLFSGIEIDWYYDPEIKPQAVGEGTTVDIPILLRNSLGFVWGDLKELDGNFKTGILKENWNKQGESFVHNFIPNEISMHFNANKLQNMIMEKISSLPNVNVIPKNVNSDDIDADYVIDCTGFPKNSDNVEYTDKIPVNSVYVTQCWWDAPAFYETLAIAVPHGWVWGIPLGNRCSIGYMYNNNITTLEEVKEDVKKIFEKWNLTPSDTTNAFSFKSFKRKQNFFENKCYNGNASFFLEPLEATSIMTISEVCHMGVDIGFGGASFEKANQVYSSFLSEIETMINLHYLASSDYGTEFWKQSKTVAENYIAERIETDQKFREVLNATVNGNHTHLNYGTWPSHSFIQNINGLGIEQKLRGML
jgi:tryptophan halogenase